MKLRLVMVLSLLMSILTIIRAQQIRFEQIKVYENLDSLQYNCNSIKENNKEKLISLLTLYRSASYAYKEDLKAETERKINDLCGKIVSDSSDIAIANLMYAIDASKRKASKIQLDNLIHAINIFERNKDVLGIIMSKGALVSIGTNSTTDDQDEERRICYDILSEIKVLASKNPQYIEADFFIATCEAKYKMHLKDSIYLNAFEENTFNLLSKMN